MRTNVSRDDVRIDGRSVGASGPTPRDVSPGRHTVVVRREGYRSVERDVDVREGETMIVRFELRAIEEAASAPAGPTPPIPLAESNRELYEKFVRNKKAASERMRGKSGVISSHHGFYVRDSELRVCRIEDLPYPANPLGQVIFLRGQYAIWSDGSTIFHWNLLSEAPNRLEVMSGPERLKEFEGVPLETYRVRELVKGEYEYFPIHIGANKFQIDEIHGMRLHRCDSL